MNEKLYKQLILSLQRFGIDTKALEENENPVISENDIAQSVLKQERFTKPLIEERLGEINGVIVNKMNAQAIKLGLPKDIVESANGDIATLFSAVNKHLKQELGKGDDEKSAKILELNKAKADLQLALEKEKEEKVSIAEKAKSEAEGQINSMKQIFEVKTVFTGLDLAKNVRENVDFYSDSVSQAINNEYDKKSVDGKTVLFKKGTEDPIYKEGTSEYADYKHVVSQKAKQLGLEKVTDVSGSGNPNPTRKPTGQGENKIYNKHGL